jgi:hypothetical protein
MKNIGNTGRRLARTDETSAYIKCATSTLEKWRLTGGGPAYFKVNGAVIYDLDIVDSWLDKHLCASTSDGGVRQ